MRSAPTACATSLTATAIRYAQCAEEPAAVIVSSGRSVEYCFMSDELKEAPGITWIRKGDPLPRESCTYRFNASADRVRRADRDEDASDLSIWFGRRREREALEQVIGLGAYGKTLTVLSGCDRSTTRTRTTRTRSRSRGLRASAADTSGGPDLIPETRDVDAPHPPAPRHVCASGAFHVQGGRRESAPRNAPRSPETQRPSPRFPCDDGRLLSRGDRI